MKTLFFNASMPRSGSELLQVILHQNPDIYASATSPLLEYQFAARGNLGLPEVKSQPPSLMERAFLAMCGSMAQGYYDSITERPVIVDKNRGWSHYYEWVAQWNPNPKMICMVRDLRSVIASMEKVYRATRHLPVGPDNPAQLQGMTVDQRAARWLNTQPVGLALSRTLDLFQRGVAKDILFVRYEDLTTAPEATMQKVYGYLGLPLFAHDFTKLEKTIIEDSSVFGPYGDHSIKPVLVPAKPSDWSVTLPPAISNNVRASQNWFFDSFNY